MDTTSGRELMGERLAENYGWTPRQKEVLDLVARGKTNQQIADALGISLDGAKWHMREILSKLAVQTREEAGEYWRRYNGWESRFARVFRGASGTLLLKGAGMTATVVAVGLAAAFVVARVMDGPDHAPNRMSEAELAPRTGRVVARISLPGQPDRVAVTSDAVWVSNQTSRTVTKIDPATNTATGSIRIESRWNVVASSGDELWVAAPELRRVFRIESHGSRIRAEIGMDQAGEAPPQLDAVQIAFAFGGLWVLDQGELLFVDPATNAVTRRIPLRFESLSGVIEANGLLWLSSGISGVIRVDPVSGEAEAFGDIKPNGYNWGMAWAAGKLWVATGGGNALVALDGASGATLHRVPLTRPGSVTAGAGSLWVPLQAHHVVVRINPATAHIVGVVATSDAPGMITATETAVWVPDGAAGELIRIDPRESGPISTAEIGATPTPVTPISN